MIRISVQGMISSGMPDYEVRDLTRDSSMLTIFLHISAIFLGEGAFLMKYLVQEAPEGTAEDISSPEYREMTLR